MKTCHACSQVKELSAFCNDKARRDGLSVYCKACLSIKRRESKLRNPESTKLSKRTWAMNNRDKMAAYERKYRREKPEVYRATGIAYRAKHKAKIKARNDVNHAIERGDMPKADTLSCGSCGQPAQDYHHHAGYDEANRLNVVALCNRCHEAADHPESPRHCTIRRVRGIRLGGR